MQRSTFQALGLFGLCLYFSAATVAQPPPPPPPGGGSTGGNYGDPGGGDPGGGDPGGGSNTGSGNPSYVVGGTAVQDNLTGAGGDNCGCPTKDASTMGSRQSGSGIPLVQETCITIGAPDDAEGSAGGSSCCDSGTGDTPQPIAINSSSGTGCGSCGGGTPGGGASASTSAYTKHKASRKWVPWNRPTQSSFGPGVFNNYDTKVYFYPDSVSGVTAVVFDAEKGRTFNFVDGLDGDTSDGVFHDLRNQAYKSLTMKDGSGTVVTSLAQADEVELSHWGGLKETFDVIDLSTDPMANEYAARLETATDLNGNTISLTYRDSLASGSGGFTAQELTDAPDRQWQMHQVTDRVGDVFTYSYQTTQESGRWVVEKIDFPNNIDVDYNYADGHLATVDHPNGDVSSYTYGQDSAAQTATVIIDSAGAGPAKTLHLTNDYMTLDANGQAQVINQPQGVFRMSVSSAGETELMVVPDSNQAGVFDIYHGTGSASNVVYGVSQRYYADGWTPVLVQETSMTITLDGTEEAEYAEVDPTTTIEDFYLGTIPGETDEAGREFSYEYDTDGFLTKKTFDADTTYEEYAYNSFKQTTRLRDRQGNVVQYEYDTNGNVTKQKTGLKEVGGQDVAQPEYAETQWAYYPVGHSNAGLLKTAFDAEWDGSSTDLHRTDYEYNARGLMTKMLKSASVTGGDRPETLWTYDADDRVATTTDPGGHQNDDTYNDRGQLIEKEYDDASAEQTLYGALGTPEEGLVVKTKDRRNVVTSYSYDSAGRTTQVTVGTAWDADILDGNADDTPIIDRNEQSITTYVYLDGTELPIEVVRDGSKAEFVYDYRQRVIEAKVYPYAGKIMSSKVVYVDNKKFNDEDYYGRKKYYGYRASDGQLIRYVTGAYPSFSLADQTAVFNLVRDTNLNPTYTIKDAITDENGRPETVIDERGTQFLTEYNTAGQVIRETKAVGTAVEAIMEMDYDEDGNVVEIRSPRYFDSTDTNGYQKCKTVMTYDGQGRVLTRTEAPGTPEAATESYAYDSEGRQVTRTDARGKVWTTSYASCCGHSVSSKNPLGHGSISNKDNGGLVTHTAGIGDVDTHTTLLDPIDAKTLRETTTRYDALGRSTAACTWLVPQGIIDPENPAIAGFDGISGQDGLTSQTLYDADLTDGIGLDSTTGVTVTNPLGGTFTVSLSAALTKMAEPIPQRGANTTFNAEARGSALVNLNAENEVSFNISDAQGRSVISGIQYPHDPLPGNTQGDLLTWSCQVHDTTEQLGNGETVVASINVDALGHTTKARSNALGHAMETIDQLGFASTVKYDSVGNSIETRDPNITGYDMVYDSLNRITSSTDQVGSQTQSTYDSLGQQVKAIDAKGKETIYVFDARGNRLSETDRLNHATSWVYDTAGNLLSLTDAENRTTNYAYDDAGNKLSEQYPDHITGAQIGSTNYGIVIFNYDELGRPTARSDQQGDTITKAIDMAGRTLSQLFVGHMTSPLAGPATTDTFTYDRLGRLLSGYKERYNNEVAFIYEDNGKPVQETLTTHGLTYTISYEHDPLGRKTQIQYPDGSVVDRTHTARGRVSTISFTPGVLGAPQQSVADFSYDNGAREVSRTMGNGIATSRSYFVDNQTQSISASSIESLSYTYDGNKNPTSEVRTGPLANHSWSTGLGGIDDEDRLVSWSATNGDTQSWSLSHTGDWLMTSINGSTETRTHNSAHEIATIGSSAMQHDSKGNLTTNVDNATLEWDFENHLQDFVKPGVDLNYTYDALGRRVSHTDNSNGGNIVSIHVFAELEEISTTVLSSGGVTNWVSGGFIDEKLMRQTPNSTSFIHYDSNHTTTFVSDDSGAVNAYYTHSMYGSPTFFDASLNILPAGAPESADYLFGGRRWDPRVRLCDNRARFYSPNTGRFLSRDPIGSIDSANLYCYVRSNPTRWIDPSGLFAQAPVDARRTPENPCDPGWTVQADARKHPNDYTLRTIEGDHFFSLLGIRWQYVYWLDFIGGYQELVRQTIPCGPTSAELTGSFGFSEGVTISSAHNWSGLMGEKIKGVNLQIGYQYSSGASVTATGNESRLVEYKIAANCKKDQEAILFQRTIKLRETNLLYQKMNAGWTRISKSVTTSGPIRIAEFALAICEKPCANPCPCVQGPSTPVPPVPVIQGRMFGE